MHIETKCLIDAAEAPLWRAISGIEAMNRWNPFVRLVSLDAHGEAISYNFTQNPARPARAMFFGMMEVDEKAREVRLRFGVRGLKLIEVYAIERQLGRLWLVHKLTGTGLIDFALGWILARRLRLIVHAQNSLLQRSLISSPVRKAARSNEGGKHPR